MTATEPMGTAIRRPMTVDEELPKAMGPGELMRALNLKSRSWFCELQRNGKFDRFRLPRPIGGKRYSGRLVQRYLEGGGK